VFSVYGCRAFLHMITIFICMQHTSFVLEFLVFVIKVFICIEKGYTYMYINDHNMVTKCGHMHIWCI
jgi:hypothetical protein